MTKPISEIIQEYLKQGDHTGWFEQVYARAQESQGRPPWSYMEPIPDLVHWSEKVGLAGNGREAIVIGCGMGDDAIYLAEQGFNVTAFDVSATAIEICKKRFPDSNIRFVQADLFEVPGEWHERFAFVLENRTIQALPHERYRETMAAIAKLVGDGGQLLLLCNGRDAAQPTNHIPWGLSQQELRYFGQLGLTEHYFDDIHVGSVRRFVVLYQK